MKLTITEVKEYTSPKGKEMVRLGFISEKVGQFVNGYPSVTQIPATKAWPKDFVEFEFNGLPKVGDTSELYKIVQKQTFKPQRSLAKEALRGELGAQPFYVGRKTSKLYLSDGKPFFRTLDVIYTADDVTNELLPNITSLDLNDPKYAGIAGMLAPKAPRPSIEAMQEAGLTLHEDTLKGLLAQDADPVADAKRADAANKIGVPA